MLLEREAELARIEAWLAAARAGQGGLLVLEAPAGAGKTRLLDEARARARSAGMALASAAGSDLEREFGFGVARQLLEPILARATPDRRAALLEGAAGLAGPALGLGAPAGAAAARGELYAVVHGLYWLTANLGAEGPLAVVVDDLQWADPPSQRYLAYLARRLEGLPLALAVAQRPALPDERRELLEAIAAQRAGEALRPGPLSPPAVEALAAAALGGAAHPDFAPACHRATGGNALLVREVLAELRRRGAAPDAEAARAVERAGADRVAEGMRRRLEGLPARAGALARAVAVLGDGCPLDAAAALAGIDTADAVRAASALSAADLLGDGIPLRFRHPIVREAVSELLSAVERAAAHGRAARALAARGAPPGEIAAHLLASPPAGDPDAVAWLRAAAAQARAQGLPDLAAAQLERALREPPPEDERAAVLRELGLAGIAAALPEGPDRLAAAIELVADPRERASLSLELAGSLYERMRNAEALEVCRRALGDLGDRDRELELMLEALLAECARMDLRVGGADVERVRRRAAGLRGETPAERYLIAGVALMSSREIDTAEATGRAAELVEHSIADRPPVPSTPETGVVASLIRAGRLERAEASIERWLARARAGGLVHRYAAMLSFRGLVAFERGALPEAEADLRASLELAMEMAAPPGRHSAALLALVRARQGALDEAGALLAEHDLEGPLPAHQVLNVSLFIRAQVRAEQGRRREALADALEVGENYARWEIVRAVPHWRSFAAILLREDDPARARALASDELELTERWGTPAPIGLARLGLGLVTGEIAQLEAAVGALAASPAACELARARLELGAALRRAGRRADAREPLRLAMDGAHACGAAPLAERARDELRATGARPRRLMLSGADALTVSERRVAALAARGLTNREIAQELFVTGATVETHLRHAFRKLDVRSRADLGAALGAGEAAPG